MLCWWNGICWFNDVNDLLIDREWNKEGIKWEY